MSSDKVKRSPLHKKVERERESEKGERDVRERGSIQSNHESRS